VASPAPLPTLRLRPADKSLRDSLAGSSATEELGQAAAAVVPSCNSRRGAFRPRILIEGEPKDCRRDESSARPPSAGRGPVRREAGQRVCAGREDAVAHSSGRFSEGGPARTPGAPDYAIMQDRTRRGNSPIASFRARAGGEPNA
jgi:hypothetical protein